MVWLSQILVAPSAAEALSWRLPGGGAPESVRSASLPTARRLQEVPPPEWVQRLQGVLEERDPRVRILSPADGDLLPDGPWILRVEVANWPLVDAGHLGLGTHLVAQLDDEPPRPLVDSEVEMPPLSPGSHRLTVYAAMPWGEAHKSPLALHQIRLHRLAPNPATVPAPGTPQLIPVSPAGRTGDPPLPLDWLLIDAPLQGLRGDASGWRLRLTLNGESVLLDQQMPLWLQGWTPGSNALLLELLDGRGDPLNPPFNSLLQEVIVPAPGAAAPSRSTPPTDLEMAVLLGEKPPSALFPPSPAAPSPAPSTARDGTSDGPLSAEAPPGSPSVAPSLGPPATTVLPAPPAAPSGPRPEAPLAEPAPEPPHAPAGDSPGEPKSRVAHAPAPAAQSTPVPSLEPGAEPSRQPSSPLAATDPAADTAAEATTEPASDLAAEAVSEPAVPVVDTAAEGALSQPLPSGDRRVEPLPEASPAEAAPEPSVLAAPETPLSLSAKALRAPGGRPSTERPPEPADLGPPDLPPAAPSPGPAELAREPAIEGTPERLSSAVDPLPAPAPARERSTEPAEPAAPLPSTPAPAAAESVAEQPATTLAMPAQGAVHPDGPLGRLPHPGPLERLRERLWN